MAKRKPNGIQADTINRYSPFTQLSFDLKRQDVFVTSFAIDFLHYKAMPSPIGKKDRGDYRRQDGVDTITSNGMIYKCSGVFSATMVDNERKQRKGDIGTLDPSTGRIIMPRFYNKDGTKGNLADGKRIYLAPGDRLYIADPVADVKVENYQEMDYEPGIDNEAKFAIVELALPIVDSRNIEYTENVDFSITCDGNVRWLDSGKNPGIDPTTGKGRIYSIRYRYKAYWYVTMIPKEVRVTNVTTDGIRSPERMAYHAVITREYMYHNQNKGDAVNQLESKDPKRAQSEPVRSITPNKFVVPVDMSAIGEENSDED